MTHLPFGAIDLLTSFTDEELEEEHDMPDGSTKKPTEMSRREIEHLKAENKKEKERADNAEQAKQQAESQAED